MGRWRKNLSDRELWVGGAVLSIGLLVEGFTDHTDAAFGGNGVLAVDDVSEKWDEFYADTVIPLIAVAATALFVWFLIVLLSRLLAMLAILRELKLRRITGVWFRVSGFALAAAAAIVFVWSPSLGRPPALMAGVAIVATLAVVLLTLGMATRARLDAVVLAATGEENRAWREELLAAIRSMNADDVRGRVEKPSASDLSDVIAVAGETKNWVFQLSGMIASLLFNLTPWRLEVAVFDRNSGAAALYRNGHLIEETSLRLPRDPGDAGHPGELLTLAGAFAATRVAAQYPDMVGFYGARGWKGIGWLQIALLSSPATRDADLDRAIHEDPGSILAEYEDVHRHFTKKLNERDSLAEYIGRLESMMKPAAKLAGRKVDALRPAPLQEWHGSPEAGHEPEFLLLRLMASYTVAIRNWSMLVPRDEWRAGIVRPARAEPRALIETFIDLLSNRNTAGHKSLEGWFTRMEQRAGLCYLLLDDEFESAGAGGEIVPGEAVDARRANRRERSEAWAGKAMKSNEFEVRYSCACYLARRFGRSEGGTISIEAIAAKLERVCRQEAEYRSIAIHDPELRPLGHDEHMRRAVLGLFEEWDIRRFAKHRSTLVPAGIRHPGWLSDESLAERVTERVALTPSEAAEVVDGARILDAANQVRFTGLDRITRMRAVRYLLDVEGHSPATLVAAHSQSSKTLQDGIAEAMFWVPSASEAHIAARFTEELVQRMHRLVIVVLE